MARPPRLNRRRPSEPVVVPGDVESGPVGHDQQLASDVGNADGTGSVDPDTAAGPVAGTGDAGTGGGKRGGWPKGKPRGSRGSAAPIAVAGIEKTLFSIHQMAAVALSQPKLALDENEAKALAQAIGEVSKHYAIPGISEKHAALGVLFGVLLSIYGPRVVMLASGGKGKAKPIQAQRQGDAPFNAAANGADIATPVPNGSGFFGGLNLQ